MRRNDKEITDRAEILDIVRAARFCRLAFCDGATPYIVPVNFGYADNALYIHCAPEGRKIDIIKQNSTVCFQMDTNLRLKEGERACDWSLDFRSVVGWGTAQILDDSAEIKEGLRVLMKQYSDGDFEFREEDLKGVAVIRIAITRMSGKKSI